MDGDAEISRELERLRAELLEFVVDALGERMANGDYAELSDRLVEAIDGRVDRAVAARLADTDWPDPDRFVDEVLAVAAGRGGDSGPVHSTRRSASRPAGGVNALQLGLLMLAAVALTAAITYFLLQSWTGDTTTNVVGPLPSDPIIVDTNGVQVDPSNVAAGNVATPPTANAAQARPEPTP